MAKKKLPRDRLLAVTSRALELLKSVEGQVFDINNMDWSITPLTGQEIRAFLLQDAVVLAMQETAEVES